MRSFFQFANSFSNMPTNAKCFHLTFKFKHLNYGITAQLSFPVLCYIMWTMAGYTNFRSDDVSSDRA